MLVDLRHECAHSELPALPALRLGADVALAWLRRNYWRAQSSALDEAQHQARQLLQVGKRCMNLMSELGAEGLGLEGGGG